MRLCMLKVLATKIQKSAFLRGIFEKKMAATVTAVGDHFSEIRSEISASTLSQELIPGILHSLGNQIGLPFLCYTCFQVTSCKNQGYMQPGHDITISLTFTSLSSSCHFEFDTRLDGH